MHLIARERRNDFDYYASFLNTQNCLVKSWSSQTHLYINAMLSDKKSGYFQLYYCW